MLCVLLTTARHFHFGDRYECISIVILRENVSKNWTNWTEKEFKASSVLLWTYTRHTLEVKGCIKVNVKYQNQEKQLPLVVVAGEGPSLLGCDCLAHIKLDWSSLHNVHWHLNTIYSNINYQ